MLLRTILFMISAFGTFAGARLSLLHLQQGEVCPMVGPLPACILVFLGYLGVCLSAIFIQKTWASRAFYLGWTPVFILACIGVGLELFKGNVCPNGPANIPQCFFSLGMAAICWVLYRMAKKAA